MDYIPVKTPDGKRLVSSDGKTLAVPQLWKNTLGLPIFHGDTPPTSTGGYPAGSIYIEGDCKKAYALDKGNMVSYGGTDIGNFWYIIVEYDDTVYTPFGYREWVEFLVKLMEYKDTTQAKEAIKEINEHIIEFFQLATLDTVNDYCIKQCATKNPDEIDNVDSYDQIVSELYANEAPILCIYDVNGIHKWNVKDKQDLTGFIYDTSPTSITFDSKKNFPFWDDVTLDDQLLLYGVSMLIDLERLDDNFASANTMGAYLNMYNTELREIQGDASSYPIAAVWVPVTAKTHGIPGAIDYNSTTDNEEIVASNVGNVQNPMDEFLVVDRGDSVSLVNGTSISGFKLVAHKNSSDIMNCKCMLSLLLGMPKNSADSATLFNEWYTSSAFLRTFGKRLWEERDKISIVLVPAMSRYEQKSDGIPSKWVD